MVVLLAAQGACLHGADDKKNKDKPKPAPAVKTTQQGPTGGREGRTGAQGSARQGANARGPFGRPAQTKSLDAHGNARTETTLKGGTRIQRDASGRPTEVHTPDGITVRHQPNGASRVEVQHPGGPRIVANGRNGSGYVERAFTSHNQIYLHRSYVTNGMTREHVYRPYYMGGRILPHYMPNHLYHPAYYRWAGTPWGHPYPYRWGWEGRPWYGYYGGYFTPYPTYAGPVFWLTDYLVATTLEAMYLERSQAQAGAPVGAGEVTADSGGPGLTPEVKQIIADDVQKVLAEAQAEEVPPPGEEPPPGPPDLFKGKGPRVFLVSNGQMDSKDNKECALAEGAVLQLVSTPSIESEWTEVKVLANRGATCPKDSVISVRTDDLLELQNQMRATLDDGLERMQAAPAPATPVGKEAKKKPKTDPNAFPAPPKAVVGYDTPAFQKDVAEHPNAVVEFHEAVTEANQAEQDAILQEQAEQREADAAEDRAIDSIRKGTGYDDVKAILGDPDKQTHTFFKDIYEYKKVVVTFTVGMVTAIDKVK